MSYKPLRDLLHRYDICRQSVRAVDAALAVLTPEERLIAEHLLIAPYRGSLTHLTQVLNLEVSSLYRRRDKIAEKLSEILLLPTD